MNTSNQANPYAPPKAEVRDATESEGAVEQAGRGERLGAALLDGFIGAILIGAPLFIGIDFAAMQAGNTQEAFSPIGLGLAGVGLLVWLGLTSYFVYKNSQTVGKKIVGIKVVRADGSHCSFGRIFWLRNVVNGIPGAIPYIGNFYGLVDHLFIFGERRQCVHDRIADTIVVKA